MTAYPKNIPGNKRKKWMVEKAGLFTAILVMNLALFLILGGQVIYKMLVAKEDQPMTFVKVKKEQVTKPKPPPARGGEGAETLNDPSVKVVPPTATLPSW